MIKWKYIETEAFHLTNAPDVMVKATQEWYATHGRRNVGSISRIINPDGTIAGHVVRSRTSRVIDAWYETKDTRPLPTVEDSQALLVAQWDKWVEKLSK